MRRPPPCEAAHNTPSCPQVSGFRQDSGSARDQRRFLVWRFESCPRLASTTKRTTLETCKRLVTRHAIDGAADQWSLIVGDLAGSQVGRSTKDAQTATLRQCGGHSFRKVSSDSPKVCNAVTSDAAVFVEMVQWFKLKTVLDPWMWRPPPCEAEDKALTNPLSQQGDQTDIPRRREGSNLSQPPYWPTRLSHEASKD